MKCDFCNKIANYDEVDTSPAICKIDGKFKVYFHGLYEEYYNINFCPICGRRLFDLNDGEKEVKRRSTKEHYHQVMQKYKNN